MVAITDLDRKLRAIIENMDTDTIASMLTSHENGTITVGDFKVTRTKQTFCEKQKHFYNVYYGDKKLYGDIALAKTAKVIVDGLINANKNSIKNAINLDNQYMSKLFETTSYGQKAKKYDNPVHWAKHSESQMKLEQIKREIMLQNH